MAQGRSNQRDRREAVITESAVEKHVTSIFDKLGIERSGEAHRRILAVLDLPAGAMKGATPTRRPGSRRSCREQAALRRVATLVARDAEPARSSPSVCEEVGACSA